MNKDQIIRAQTRRGIAESCMRTKYNYYSANSPDDVLFELEAPLSRIDGLMMEFGNYNVQDPKRFHEEVKQKIYGSSFLLTGVDGDLPQILDHNLTDRRKSDLLRYLVAGDMPHAIYRVRLKPNRLILSSYTRPYAVGNGSGDEIELKADTPAMLKIDYPLGCRDKSDFAVVEFCTQPLETVEAPVGRSVLIRLSEYRIISEVDSQLVRTIESCTDKFRSGYLIIIQKKESIGT